MSEFGTGLRAHLGHERPLQSSPAPTDEEAPAAVPSPVEQELEQRLVYLLAAEAALDERERRFALREETLATERARLDAEEERLGAERRRLDELGPTGDVRELMRRRTAQHADLVWGSFEDALRSDDLALRLAAARALVGDLFAAGGHDGTVADAFDELAQIRQRRLGG